MLSTIRRFMSIGIVTVMTDSTSEHKGATSESPRERMLSSATELFQRNGVAATALSDIIEHSGAPRGSLYHYFPEGKSQIAAEATAQAGRQLGGMLTVLTATHGPVETIRLMVGHFRRQLEDSGFTAGCPAAPGALEGGAAGSDARRAAGEAFTTWEATVAAAFWQRGLAAVEADALATLAISAIEGALVLGKAQQSTRALDRVEKALVAQVKSLLPVSGPDAAATTDG
ncbi:TetR/AcrR family transcriptional regulator [Streptomyces sp. NPDC091385]|uniref:TetR/AcrR family transcriptional regulator n=1 Tax=Streptomyces sp. NPDC091385 TaxID=3365997 RepID=UPI0037F1EE91